MNKAEFVDLVAERAHLSRREASHAVDAILESITDILRQGDEISFTGFGKFSTQRRKERPGVNPRNPSQRVTIPAATVPKFSAGSSLRSAVREEDVVVVETSEAGEEVLAIEVEVGEVRVGEEVSGSYIGGFAGEPGVPWDDDDEER